MHRVCGRRLANRRFPAFSPALQPNQCLVLFGFDVCFGMGRVRGLLSAPMVDKSTHRALRFVQRRVYCVALKYLH